MKYDRQRYPLFMSASEILFDLLGERVPFDSISEKSIDFLNLLVKFLKH